MCTALLRRRVGDVMTFAPDPVILFKSTTVVSKNVLIKLYDSRMGKNLNNVNNN